MFEKKFIDLGDIIVGKQITIEFPYTDIKKVSKLEVSCDCTRVYNYTRDKKIVVKYTPVEVPTHLETGYSIHKTITVTFISDLSPIEESVETLVFVGEVKPKSWLQKQEEKLEKKLHQEEEKFFDSMNPVNK